MTDIYVINPHSLNIVGVIDNYESVIWRPSYSDIGDFEVYIPATSHAIGLLQKNNYLVRSSDISSDGTIYRNVMIIKNIKLTTDVENGDYLTVTGRELKSILNQRIVWSQFDKTNENVDLFLHELVAVEGCEPVDEARKIPRLSLDVLELFPERIQKQITYDKLGQAVVDVCTTYNLGWEIYINKAATNYEWDDGLLLFRVYKGVDRSYDQVDNPFVVFSDDFENLYNTEYQLSTENYANVTLIGGKGEGWERIRTTVGEASGLNRYEVFTDAKDINSNKENDAGESEEMSQDEYIELLREKGRETLSSLGYTESFTGEVVSDVTFKYKRDFDLGDVVTVINKYGIAQNVRVTSAIESEDENGAKLVPQFNI